MLYVCPICGSLRSDFTDFRLHMEHDHEKWFLGKRNFILDKNVTGCTNEELSLKQDYRSSRRLSEETLSDKSSDSNTNSEQPKLNNVFNPSTSRQLNVSIHEEVLEKLLENKEKVIIEAEKQVHNLSAIVKAQNAEIKCLQNRLKISLDAMKMLNLSLQDKDSSNELRTREVEELQKQKIEVDNMMANNKRKLKSSVENLITKTKKAEETVKEQHQDEEICRICQMRFASHLSMATRDGKQIFMCKDLVEELESSDRVTAVSDFVLEPFKMKIQQRMKKNIPVIHVDSGEVKEREILLLVFRYLDAASLFACSQVCQLWRNCSLHPHLWKNVVISGSKVSNEVLTNIAVQCTETQCIIVKNLSDIEGESPRILPGFFELGLERVLQFTKNSLKTFAVVDCSDFVTNRVAWLVSCHCRHLENFVYISSTDCINSEMIWSLGVGCRKLKLLIIPPLIKMHPCRKSLQLSNRCLITVSKVFPDLRVLCIGGHEIDIRGLISIAQYCQRLESLELDHMREIREKTAAKMCQNGLKYLRYLQVTYTPITPKAIMMFYEKCSYLQKIFIQLNVSVYFPNSESHTPENLDKYHETLKHIELLIRKTGLGRTLRIKSDRCPTLID